MKPLTEYTEAELHEELRRREEARRDALEVRNKRIIQTLTMELIDVFLPEHDRTSCDDSNLSLLDIQPADEISDRQLLNQPARCTRCALIHLMKRREIPENITIELSIEEA